MRMWRVNTWAAAVVGDWTQASICWRLASDAAVWTPPRPGAAAAVAAAAEAAAAGTGALAAPVAAAI